MNGPSARLKRERGGAMVEFALLQIVMVPLLLYAVFLMDAAYMKVDLQETVVAGVWDWSARNTEASGSGSHASLQDAEREKTQQMVRLIYSDHTSAFDDGADPSKPGYNAEDRLRSSHNHDKHHTGFGAQYTFMWGNTDTQFHCTIGDEDLSWGIEPNFDSYGKSKYSAGGRVRCEAEACIYNYIVPQQFMQEFAQVETTALVKREGSAHEPQCGGGANANIRLKESAALSFNTWALTNGGKNASLASADIGKPDWMGVPNATDKDNPFHQRVHHTTSNTGLFTATHLLAQGAATVFSGKAISEKIMTVVPVDVPGLSLTGLPPIIQTRLVARYEKASFEKSPVRTKPPGFLGGLMHDGFQSTPFEKVNDDYKTVGKKRRAFYMGCNTAEKANCN